MDDILPELLWTAYCAKADNKSFDGKPLPQWGELGADRQACWKAAADAARKYLTPLS